jgi:hypothetical protein
MGFWLKQKRPRQHPVKERPEAVKERAGLVRAASVLGCPS